MIVLFLPQDNPVHQTSQATQDALREAQDSVLARNFEDSYSFMEHVADNLKSNIKPPPEMREKAAAYVADRSMTDLIQLWSDLFREAGSPADVVQNLAVAAAERSQLLRAYQHPEKVLSWVQDKVQEQVKLLPKGAADLRRGRNKGDVLDPYIFAATQIILCGDDRGAAVSATMAHKALMILEGMLGHLHEEVVGRMRGNMRVPEPRIRGKKTQIEEVEESKPTAGTLNLLTNPFPGADAVQPPLEEGSEISFHQIKSKTGSMNSSGGAALGRQLKKLRETYGGLLYSHSLVGSTLSGHRSMKGIENEEPQVICTVGDEAFRVLTRSESGAELLLRVYLAAFRTISGNAGQAAPAYSLMQATADAVEEFEKEAEEEGQGFLESLLHHSTQGPVEEQDSRLFNDGRRAQAEAAANRKKEAAAEKERRRIEKLKKRAEREEEKAKKGKTRSVKKIQK